MNPHCKLRIYKKKKKIKKVKKKTVSATSDLLRWQKVDAVTQTQVTTFPPKYHTKFQKLHKKSNREITETLSTNVLTKAER